MKFFLLFVSIFVFLSAAPAKRPSVLVITGGHSYDTTEFAGMFRKIGRIRFESITQPKANLAIAEGKAMKYDVLVFYDMWQSLSEAEKQGYLNLCRSGKPMLFMHHSLVSYQDWPEFEKIRGGKYLENSQNSRYSVSDLSTYRHDVWVDLNISDTGHPVTKGLHDFRLFDEVYGNYRVEKSVKPLITTSHPESSKIIAWENHYMNSPILFIQPGHDSRTFNDPNFISLLRQAIFYLADKKIYSKK